MVGANSGTEKHVDSRARATCVWVWLGRGDQVEDVQNENEGMQSWLAQNLHITPIRDEPLDRFTYLFNISYQKFSASYIGGLEIKYTYIKL